MDSRSSMPPDVSNVATFLGATIPFMILALASSTARFVVRFHQKRLGIDDILLGAGVVRIFY
jgi:hypothetical protein